MAQQTRRAAGAAQPQRGPGWAAPAAPRPPPSSAAASVLVVLRNLLAEPLSVRAEAWTPAHNGAFLDVHVADLEAGGATAFVAAPCNDVRLDLPYVGPDAPAGAPQRLVLLPGGEYRLQPGQGCVQKQTALPPGLPFPSCLTISVQEVPRPGPAAEPSFEELVAQHAGCASVRAAVAAAGSREP